jgi:anti-anti-sigma factor
LKFPDEKELRVFNLTEEPRCIRIEFGSEMRHVDRVLVEACHFLERCCLLEPSLEFNIVLRELLINAIEHGNLGIPERPINLVIMEIGSGRFQITVQDEGTGFDHRRLNLMIPDDPRKVRGRGLSLVHELSEKVEFNRQGNGVTVTLSIARGTEFMVFDRDGWAVIRPNGDITASAADRLKEILSGLTAKGHRRFRFDLQKVGALDSIGLSVFILLARTLEEKGDQAGLEISNIQPDLLSILRITRLDAVYDLFPAQPN